MKIKKSFLKITISALAVLGFLASYFPKSFWGEPVNLDKIESGSKKIFKNIEIKIVHADTGGSGGGDWGLSGCSSGDDGGGGGY